MTGLDPAFLLLQGLNGLSSASSLFITACGLTIVFGVTRIVNFAHGSLYMLGVYVAATLLPRLLDLSATPLAFFAGVLVSALIIGCLGVLLELLLLRRIYRAPELFQLLATFAVVLVVQDAVVAIFGPEEILGPRAPGLRGSVEILGRRFPIYDLVLIAAGPLVLGAVWLLLKRTRFGVLVRAATQDREMVGALGVNQAALFTGALFLGAFLAGLGGALQVPKISANTELDLAIIAECFVVTVVGGMGSVGGAFLAALLIGLLEAYGILVFPRVTDAFAFLLMAVVLIARPYGLFGRPEVASPGAIPAPPVIRPWGGLERGLAAATLAGLVALPFVADAALRTLVTEILIFALFAFSLHLLVGIGGVVSFGHAAYFGLGAYGAALVLKQLDAPMGLSLIAAPLVAALGAALVGAFVVRLSGIYLAMLTLAAAQILWAGARQWVELTGGDNGIVGVWPSPPFDDATAFYFLALGLVVLAVAGLRHVVEAPFGYGLRAARDSRLRAEALGIHAGRQRILAFILSGAAAGLAGGLYAFRKGTVNVDVLSIPTSVDALIMLLLGGIETVTGPLAGAAAFLLLRDRIMPLTELWRSALGATIIALVILFPHGLFGTLARWREARAKPAAAGTPPAP
jgi:branched-chain amino acid transport system permease protein